MLCHNFLFKPDFLSFSRFECSFEPSFEATDIRLFISCEFEFHWLVLLPEFFNCGPLAFALMVRFAHVARTRIILVFSIDPVEQVSLFVVEQFEAVQVVVLEIVLASAHDTI